MPETSIAHAGMRILQTKGIQTCSQDTTPANLECLTSQRLDHVEAMVDTSHLISSMVAAMCQASAGFVRPRNHLVDSMPFLLFHAFEPSANDFHDCLLQSLVRGKQRHVGMQVAVDRSVLNSGYLGDIRQAGPAANR